MSLDRINQCWSLICLVALIACTSLGCGQEQVEHPIPDLVPVKGTLVINGHPEPGVVVTLMPQGSTPGQSAFGITDENGAFECQYAMGGDGCPQGTYAVLCSKLVTPDGQPIPEGSNAADVMAEDKIPMKYRSLERPFQTVEVSSAGISDLTIELKTKG